MATIETLPKKPRQRGEVIIDEILSIDADITVTDTLELGSIVATTDDGASFSPVTDALPSTPYRLGILGEYATKTGKYSVLLIGKAKLKQDLATEIKTALFKSNLILL